MKKKTREFIIDTAIDLFNKQGSHSITTNHIAKACSISPGNLYYHFSNKEEIIRNIFMMIISDFSSIMTYNAEQAGRLPDLTVMSRNMGELYFKYRFFYLELPSLLALDSSLAELYHDNEKIKHSIIKEYINSMILLKLVKPGLDNTDIDAFVSNTWILTDFWLSYLFVSGEKITRENIMRGMNNFIFSIRPFLSAKGLKFISGE